MNFKTACFKQTMPKRILDMSVALLKESFGSGEWNLKIWQSEHFIREYINKTALEKGCVSVVKNQDSVIVGTSFGYICRKIDLETVFAREHHDLDLPREISDLLSNYRVFYIDCTAVDAKYQNQGLSRMLIKARNQYAIENLFPQRFLFYTQKGSRIPRQSQNSLHADLPIPVTFSEISIAGSDWTELEFWQGIVQWNTNTAINNQRFFNK